MKNYDQFRSLLLLLLLGAFSFSALKAQCTVPEQPITIAFFGLLNDNVLDVGETRTFCVRATIPNGTPTGQEIDGTIEFNTNITPYPFSVTIRDIANNNVQTLDAVGEAATIVGGELYEIKIMGDFPGVASIDLIPTGGQVAPLQINLLVVANLPVTWSRPLAAQPNGKVVELNWAVQDQIDVAGYELERSQGDDWKAVNEVAVIASDLEIEYRTTDILQTETTYYRIRQWDFDGSESFSNIVQVAGGAFAEELTVFPNPATHELRFASDQEVSSIRIFNQWGQMIREVATTGKSGSLMINDLAPGTYLMITDQGTTRQFSVF